MHSHSKVFVLLMVTALLLFPACTNSTQEQQSSASENASDRLKIGIIPKAASYLYWKAIHAGAEKAAQELNVEVIWESPRKEYNSQEQIHAIQNLANQGIDAIVLAPINSNALITPVSTVHKRNIPVVIIDAEINSTNFSSLVSTDNKFSGKLCGKQLAELLGGKGKVIMLRCYEGSSSTIAREDGFLEAIKEYGPSIELVSTNEFAGTTTEEAFNVSQNLLNRFGHIDGVFTSNEFSTEGMLQALQKSGKAAKVKFIGFDSNPAILAGLQNKEIHGLAIQNPFKMGYEAIRTAVAVFKKQPFEKRIDTGITMVTLDNLDDPQTRDLLNPDIDKWLSK